ncbi:FAD/NAD(P)-binding domain-containing protein [Fistulina hepatica ATCC 64428]|uniref:NADH:ubiquinone reductase (non-electrogenic) n=1 Tax=Fistulina hepatica ATCC 64428 TaxID=1128425 RepID=A0A0D7AK72_9AGAR|nr:FAD/NAD(P)-binding domain-containing protein [Fistulina hepatica ATCC 64428]
MSLSRTVRREPTVLHGHLLKRVANYTATPSEHSQPIPPPPPKPSRWTRFLTILGRTTLVTILAGTGAFYYVTYKERHPGTQLPYDPSKKTIVVLGSGWGATSFLRHIDNTDYNIVVVSPTNYFLFTPLLPSVAVGTLSPRSILQPTRYETRHKPRQIKVIEATATNVDPKNKTVTFSDLSPIRGQISETTIAYDYLVYAIGAEVQTFGIPGVQDKACFMKELKDAENMQSRFLDCLESAGFPGQSEEEIDRLLHMVVVGGGPTGIEVSAEIRDFLEEDLRSWYPELAQHIRISLVEAMPSVLPMFSKQLIEYTVSSFRKHKIDVLTGTMVKEVKDKSVVLQMPDKSIQEVPCGLVIWAGGNKQRDVTRDLMVKLKDDQKSPRGLQIDDFMELKGASGIYAIGDVTHTSYAPTAQVANQEGAYLARHFKTIAKRDALLAQRDAATSNEEREKIHARISKTKMRPFHYTHQGTLAYIGSDEAIADLPFMNNNYASAGTATYLFWRSAYISNLFTLRNRTLVAADWMRTMFFGRDVSRN